MLPSSEPITVIAADPEELAAMSQVVAQVASTAPKESEHGLSRMNGTAVALASTAGTMVIRIRASDVTDLEQVEQLARSPDRKAKLIILSDPDLPLSTARRLLEAGIADVLPSPLTPNAFEQAMVRLGAMSSGMKTASNRAQGRIITVVRARGGVGATTVATNLASALQFRSGRFRKAPTARVALVDLDLQFGSVASFLDIDPRETLSEMAVQGMMPDREFVESGMVTTKDGLDVLPAPSRFVPHDALSREQIGALLDDLRENHDYVVVDLPHGLFDWVQAAIDRSGKLLLVTDTTIPSLRQSKRLLDFYLEENPTLKIDVVVNFEAKPLFRRQHHCEAEKLIGRSFSAWLPFDPKLTREALDRGVPLARIKPRAPLSRAVAQLASSIAGQLGPVPSQKAAG